MSGKSAKRRRKVKKETTGITPLLKGNLTKISIIVISLFVICLVIAFYYFHDKYNSVKLCKDELSAGDVTKSLITDQNATSPNSLEKEGSAFAKPPALKDQKKERPVLLSPLELKSPISIAELNLRCAQGLPGSEDLDIGKCLKTLEEWAEMVRRETERCIHMYKSNPGDYYNSEAYFRMLILITVLQKDLGVHYNMELADLDGLTNEDLKKPFTSDARNVFIHGAITGKRQGTCASMPTMTIAVGRLLGYPLYLALAKYHTFVRWEDDNEKINFEVTNGLSTYPDEHYTEWPMEMTEKEKSSNYYIKPSSPIEEYSVFLQIRISILAANGRFTEARKLAEEVKALTPNCPYNDEGIEQLANAEAMHRLNMRRISSEIAKQRVDTILNTENAAFAHLENIANRIIIEFIPEYSIKIRDGIRAMITVYDDSGEKIIQEELRLMEQKKADEIRMNYLKAKIKAYDDFHLALFQNPDSSSRKDSNDIWDGNNTTNSLTENGEAISRELYNMVESDILKALPSPGMANTVSPKEINDMQNKILQISKSHENQHGLPADELIRQKRHKDEMDSKNRKLELNQLERTVEIREVNLRQTAEEILRISTKRVEDRLLEK